MIKYRMRLRAWLAGVLAITVTAGAWGAEAPRVGLLAWSSCDEAGRAEFGPFLDGLAELGYRPGETVTMECRAAGGRYDGLVEAARQLVAMPVDVIVTNSQPAGRAAHEASGTIPIVTIISGDPVAAGLAASLARPAGNVTGVSYYATELTAKRLELLKEMLPGLVRVGVLANPDVSYLPFEEDTKRAADALGLALTLHHVKSPGDLDDAFAAMQAQGAQAAFVLPDVMLAHEASQIAQLALEHRLPAMGWAGWFTAAGLLMSYSADYVQMIHRLAFQVDRILQGAKPGEVPIEQPTTFLLSINLTTAEALGVVPPAALLSLADELIE